MKTDTRFFAQLDVSEKLSAYKEIKRILIENDCLTVENILSAMENRVCNIFE